jgi:4-hydroxybenzoate polyprenyltransferase
VALVFCAFCAISSAGYLVNDICDIEKDRLHPIKKNRPIASGKVSVPRAYAWALVLVIMSLAVAFLLSWQTGLVLAAYAVLMFCYSRGLKRVPLLDIGIIAIGFVFRILSGGFAAAVPVSLWLLACTFIAALLLGLGKRIAELHQMQGAQTRQTLGFYTPSRTAWMEKILGILAVILYAAYTLSGKHSTWMVLSITPVTYGIWRYSKILKTISVEGPTELLLKDTGLQVALLSWFVIVLFVLSMSA